MTKAGKDRWVLREAAKEVLRVFVFLFLLAKTVVGLVLRGLLYLLACRCIRCRRSSPGAKIAPSATRSAVPTSNTGTDSGLSYQVRINRLKNLKEREFYDRFGPVLAFFEQNSAQIELDYKEHIYTRKFIAIPYFRYLPKEIKTDFNDTVDRSSRESKVRSLVFDFPRFIASAKYTHRVDTAIKRIPVLSVLSEYYQTIRLLNFLCAIALNVLLLLAHSGSKPRESDPKFASPISIVAHIKVVITITVLFLIAVKNIPEINDIFTRPGILVFKLRSLLALFFESGMAFFSVYLASIFLGLYYNSLLYAFTISDCINR